MLDLFTTLVVQPIFNLLVFIYAIIPGHDLGIAIIIFTVLVRLALWPLLRKQLHHGRQMRKLQPELKKIKKAADGDRQKEMQLQMELYKERGIRPMASIGTLFIQLPIFIGLYQAVLRITNDPKNIIEFSYGSVQHLSWIQHLAENINRFDERLLGFADLTKHGVQAGHWYIPAAIIAVLSTVMQFLQTRLTMVSTQDSRSLSEILKEAASGKEADQSEVTAAVSKVMLFVLPFFTFIFALIVPSALSLYMLVSSTVGYLQTRQILGEDIDEMTEIANEKEAAVKPKKTTKIVTKTTISTSSGKKAKTSAPKTSTTGNKKKRRR